MVLISEMKLTEFIGLQFFESMYLLVLFCIPIVVAQQYIGAIVLALLIFLALSTLTRKLLYKAVEIKGQGVLITGCDTGENTTDPVTYDRKKHQSHDSRNTHSHMAAETHVT